MNNLGTNQDFCKGATVTVTAIASTPDARADLSERGASDGAGSHGPLPSVRGIRTTGAGTGRAGLADSSFTIEGNATEPISPGVMAPLDLKLTNPTTSPCRSPTSA